MYLKVANPLIELLVSNWAEPTCALGLPDCWPSSISNAFPLIVKLRDESATPAIDCVSGKVNGRSSGLPSLPKKFKVPCPDEPLVLTSVRVVSQPPPEAICAIAPAKAGGGAAAITLNSSCPVAVCKNSWTNPVNDLGKAAVIT